MPGTSKLPQQRVRTLTRKLASSPLLPVLGITKTVETVIAGGPTMRWVAYAVLVTGVWIYADDLQRRASEATEAAQDAVDDATSPEN
ncbi:hypothetical protein [Halobacterium sp. CBA1126]|uniref:hypothetical protein n=1 Tax=Halobacterium sp. CBA1126 TaxID=2668074 RepID=UPI0012FA39EE|nr:hypothetical protein [Halobacterium sp. CBA1126]MUV59987.1 hypothetical protein [Halobacterium sp. CBA1126]